MAILTLHKWFFGDLRGKQIIFVKFSSFFSRSNNFANRVWNSIKKFAVFFQQSTICTTFITDNLRLFSTECCSQKTIKKINTIVGLFALRPKSKTRFTGILSILSWKCLKNIQFRTRKDNKFILFGDKRRSTRFSLYFHISIEFLFVLCKNIFWSDVSHSMT